MFILEYMITVEKIQIRNNKFLRNLFSHLSFWYCSLLFYIFLTGDELFFKNYFNLLESDSIYYIILFLSISLSILFTFLDILFTDRVLRFFPRRFMIFLKSSLYFISAFVIILIAVELPLKVIIQKDYNQILNYLPELNINFIRFLVYFYLSAFLIKFLKAVIKKVGRGNFRNWVLGMLNKPREQKRIFMFIDMKASTNIAEKLMHRKYSHLVQDVFNDMSVVDNYNGDIYQYLGDGAIISWNLKSGLKHNNCLNSFYAFNKVINKRERYYQRKYGISPKFKAGIHVGNVMVLQVGQIRRDISYNGDTLNATARIESMCNEYKQKLLISGDLYDMLIDKNGFIFKNLGNIKLKGKRKGVDLYQVKKK
jgi:adenylate cyclase